jgi:signal transduction histidine kinase
MKPLRILVFLTLFSLSAQVSVADNNALPDVDVSQQLAEAEKRTDNWKTAFWVMTGVYIFVYIMGRRRLVRKIWARNKELKLALDKAQESDRLKTAFIRNISHEVRTPLNAINGFSQLLCSSDFELSQEERQDMKDRISKSSETLTDIFSEVLEMSEGESLHSRSDVDVNTLCREMIEEQKKVNGKGLDIRYVSSLPDDFRVHTNEPNVRLILRHLLDNAVKFTKQGSIMLSLDHEGDTLHFAVTDTGCGIPADKSELIFERFAKLDSFSQGAGLGLSIARMVAQHLGGTLTLDTTYTKGAKFDLVIPYIPKA